MYIVYIVSGVIALAIALTVFLSKEKKRIQLLKLIDDAFWAVNYFCKGAIAYTGAAQNGVSLLRDIIFYFRAKGKKWASSVCWCVAFCLFFAALPFLTWIGPISILPAVSSMISTSALFNSNATVTRWLSIPAQILTLIYAAVVGNVFGILSNSFMMISAVVGLCLDRKREKQ